MCVRPERWERIHNLASGDVLYLNGLGHTRTAYIQYICTLQCQQHTPPSPLSPRVTNGDPSGNGPQIKGLEVEICMLNPISGPSRLHLGLKSFPVPVFWIPSAVVPVHSTWRLVRSRWVPIEREASPAPVDTPLPCTTKSPKVGQKRRRFSECAPTCEGKQLGGGGGAARRGGERDRVCVYSSTSLKRVARRG